MPAKTIEILRQFECEFALFIFSFPPQYVFTYLFNFVQ